jgi:hypothetical protein
MARPYLYHQAAAFSRSEELSNAIARKELHDAGFQELSKPAVWEHVGVNADTIAVVTCAPLQPGKTYVHVVATSLADAPAKKWATELMKQIKESKLVLTD